MFPGAAEAPAREIIILIMFCGGGCLSDRTEHSEEAQTAPLYQFILMSEV